MRIVGPERRTHTYVQEIEGTPSEVFPLLCPVREREWVPGWEPSLVISASGVAEDGCVFLVPAGDAEDVWVVTKYRPDAEIAFVKVTPGRTVGRIGIVLEADGADRCRARVTYSYTALGEAGRETVRSFTEDHYRRFMEAWEAELNHFLRTGTRRPASAGDRGPGPPPS